MNAFGELLNHPLTHRAGWALLHSLWQGAIAAALFAVIRIMLRRCSANARYVAGCLLLFLVALAPMVTFFMVHPSATGSAEVSLNPFQSSHSNLLRDLSPLLPSFAFGAEAPATMLGIIESFERSIPLLVACWAIGVLVFSLKLLEGCWYLKRLRRNETEPLHSALIETLNDLRCRLNISRPVQMLKSGLVEVPTVIGWLRPLILLPAGTLMGLTPLQLEAILAHELAHVGRNDYLVNAFQLVVETLMFYHPAVWWVSRCIREEREHCCDDLVIRVGSDRVEYASALATLEELRAASPQLAFAANGGPLLRRIRRLVGAPGDDRPVSARELGGLALLGIGLGLIITGICLLVGQPKYQAFARMKLERDTSPQLTSTDGKVSLSIGDPYFLQTEFAVLQSDIVLGQVAKDLGLEQEWGRRYRDGARLKFDKTVALLKSRLELKAVRDTSLIQIHVFSDKPEEAATIANAIATAYKDHRLSQRLLMSRLGVVTLEERFKKQEKEIEEAQKQVSGLRESLHIPDAVVNADGPTLSMSAETLRNIEGQRIQSKTDLIRQETMLDHLKQLTPEQLIQAIPTAVQDPQINTLLESLTMAEQSLITKKNEFGPESSEIRGLNSQIADLNAKIKARVEGIFSALTFRISALKSGLAAMEAEVTAANTNDIAKARQSRPYYEAKRHLEQLQRFNQMLTLKIAAENIDADLPKSTLTELVDRAVASGQPILSNRYRGTSCSALGLLLALMGLGMLRSSMRFGHSSKQS